VFLTHDWGTDKEGWNNHKRVAVINRLLKEKGVRTWFDEEELCKNHARRPFFLTKRFIPATCV
jgi:hypothetical protein